MNFNDLISIEESLVLNHRLNNEWIRCILSRLKYAKGSVLLYIISRGNDCYFSSAVASESLGMKKDTFRKYKNELIEDGLIKCEEGRSRAQVSRYHRDNKKIAMLIWEGMIVEKSIKYNIGRTANDDKSHNDDMSGPKKGSRKKQGHEAEKVNDDMSGPKKGIVRLESIVNDDMSGPKESIVCFELTTNDDTSGPKKGVVTGPKKGTQLDQNRAPKGITKRNKCIKESAAEHKIKEVKDCRFTLTA